MERTSSLRPTAELVYYVLLYKIVLFMLINMSVSLLPAMYNMTDFYGNFHWTNEPSPGLAKYLETWDTQFYLYLSRFGYKPGIPADAFFPLWPYCMRIFSYVTGGSLLWAGLILSNIFSAAALVLMHRFISVEENVATADKALLLMLAYPGAFFLLMAYSESLFLLLSILIFMALSKGRYPAACALGFLAVLTRPVGILWVVPIAVDMLKGRRFRSLTWLLLLVLGYAVYLAIMYYSTGNALEGFAVQGIFKSGSAAGKIFNITGFIHSLTDAVIIHDVTGSVIDRILFAWLLLSLLAIYKRGPAMLFYALVMGVIPAMTNSFMAYMRFSLMLIPMFIVGGAYFSDKGREKWLTPLLAALFGLQIFMLVRHINFYWAG